MTDYDTMAAGRELDALVAEKVMGWRWVVWKPGQFRGSIAAFEQRKGVRFLKSPDCISGGMEPAKGTEPTREKLKGLYNTWRSGINGAIMVEALFPPAYSTNIAEAWKVLEKLSTLGHRIAIAASGSPRDKRWDAWNCNKDWPHEIEDTAALAICHAALRAIESQAE